MIFAFDEFELDDVRLELRRADEVVKVDAVVLRLLVALVRNAGRLVTKEELVRDVWEGRAVTDNVITVSMARLRKALDDRRGEREIVATVYGRGYRFVRPVVTRYASERPPSIPEPGSATGPALVGRERTLTRLRRALSEACAGRGRMCALLGEPGIGKTRVVDELERELAGTQVRVAWGFCREAGDTPPLSPWVRLLRAVVKATPRAEWEASLGVAQTHALFTTLGERAGAAVTSAGWDYDLLLRVLALAAERAPWVLVLDDLHRADAATLELLSLLVDEVAQTRLLVLATVRDQPGGHSPRAETPLPYVLGHRNCERMVLERLREDEVATYVASVLDECADELAHAIYEKSEGNPFFMVELTRQVADAPEPAPELLVLPGAALDSIRQRLMALAPEVRETLSIAGVLGRRFELSVLHTLLDCELAPLVRQLDEAVQGGFLVSVPESVVTFAFAHELMRAVLYESLALGDRRRWHAKAAAVLEQRAAQGGDPVPPAELAHHLYAALPESDPAKTLKVCRAAAATAGGFFAGSDVARYLRHALEALDLLPQPSVPLRMEMLLTTALFTRGHAPAQFVHAIHEVVRLARESGDPETLAKAAILFNVHPELMQLPGATDVLESALAMAPPERPGLRAVVLAALACATPQAFRASEVDRLMAEAEQLAQSTAHVGALYVVYACKLYAQGGPLPGRDADAATRLLERIAPPGNQPMPMLPVALALFRAVRAQQDGHHDAMHAAIERGAACGRDLRHPGMRWHFARFAAMARINAGAWAEGLAELETLHRRAERRSILGSAAFCTFDRLVLAYELGSELPAVDDAARHALAYASSDPPSVWSMKIRALATAGCLEEARSGLRAVPASEIANLPCDSQYLGTLGHLARASLRLGALDYAEALLAALAPYTDHYAVHVSFFCEGSVPHLRGLLARALGRLDLAIDELALGVERDERVGLVLCAAKARLSLAECLRVRAAAGDLQRARQLTAPLRESSGLHELSQLEHAAQRFD